MYMTHTQVCGLIKSPQGLTPPFVLVSHKRAECSCALHSISIVWIWWRSIFCYLEFAFTGIKSGFSCDAIFHPLSF